MRPKRTAQFEHYKTKLSDHHFWFEMGLDLHQAASAVEPLVTRLTRTKRAKLGLEAPTEATEAQPRVGIQEVYLMLLGYAAECFIKRRLTRVLLRGKKKHGFNVKELPKELKSHNLRQLCDDAKIKVWPIEERAVRLLEGAVMWRGRYPVPRRAVRLEPTLLSESDLEDAKSFVQRLMPRPRPAGSRKKRPRIKSRFHHAR